MEATELSLEEIWEKGKARGEDIGRGLEPPAIGENDIETTSEVKEVFLEQCSEAEENDRQFTPFEYTAKELNEREDQEEAWEYFEQGIADGFEKAWEEKEIKVTEEFAIDQTKTLLDKLYGSIRIGEVTYYSSEILAELDPEALFQMALDWVDSQNLDVKE